MARIDEHLPSYIKLKGQPREVEKDGKIYIQFDAQIIKWRMFGVFYDAWRETTSEFKWYLKILTFPTVLVAYFTNLFRKDKEAKEMNIDMPNPKKISKFSILPKRKSKFRNKKTRK